LKFNLINKSNYFRVVKIKRFKYLAFLKYVMDDKNNFNLEDYVKDDIQKSSDGLKEISSYSDANLEKIVEEIIPKQKTFKDHLYDVITWPVKNYHWILGASLPISILSFDLLTKQPIDWTFFASIPMGFLMSQFISARTQIKVKNKEKESSGIKIWNWLYDNALIVGCGLGAAVAAYYLTRTPNLNLAFASVSAFKDLVKKFPENTELYKTLVENLQFIKKTNMIIPIYSFLSGALLTTVMQLIASFHPEKIKMWKYAGLGIINYFKPEIKEETRVKNTLEIFNRAIKEGEENKDFLREMALYNFRLGNFNEGIYAYSKILEHREKGLYEEMSKTFLSSIADKLSGALGKYVSRKRGYNLKGFEEKIANAFDHYYSWFDFKSSLKNWKEALAIAPKEHRREFELLYAMFLEDAEHKELAKEAIGRWISQIVSTAEFEKNLKEIPSSRNEVFELTQSEFLKDTIIVKRNKGVDIANEEKRIYAEYFANLFLTYLFKHRIAHGFKSIVPRSLFTFKHEDGKIYHIMRRTSGRNLEEAFKDANKQQKEEYLKKVMESSALIHANVIDFLKKDERGYYFASAENKKIYRINIDEFNYTDILKTRLIRRLGENSSLEKFLKEAEDYSHSFDNIPQVFAHGDAYITNFIEDGSWIDLEKRTIANPMMDIAGILEAPECAEADKALLLRHYTKEFMENYQHKKKKGFENTMMDLYIPNKIFNAFYQIGSKSAQKQPDQAEYFLEKVMIYLQEAQLNFLLNSFAEYINKTGNEEFIKKIKKV